MVVINLHRKVIGFDLAKKVESAMRKMDGFKLRGGSNYNLNSDGKKEEVRRRLVARKPYRVRDLFIQEFQDATPPLGAFNYFIPFLGQATFVSFLLDKNDGRCILDTTLDLKEDYNQLLLVVKGRFKTNIFPEDKCYRYVENDVKSFVKILRKEL